jgi:hypothetical protein
VARGVPSEAAPQSDNSPQAPADHLKFCEMQQHLIA